jgi:hypothetical protein
MTKFWRRGLFRCIAIHPKIYYIRVYFFRCILGIHPKIIYFRVYWIHPTNKDWRGYVIFYSGVFEIHPKIIYIQMYLKYTWNYIFFECILSIFRLFEILDFKTFIFLFKKVCFFKSLYFWPALMVSWRRFDWARVRMAFWVNIFVENVLKNFGGPSGRPYGPPPKFFRKFPPKMLT